MLVIELYSLTSYLLIVLLNILCLSNMLGLCLIFRGFALSVGAAIFIDITLLSELVICHCFRPNPYTKMCVSTVESF